MPYANKRCQYHLGHAQRTIRDFVVRLQGYYVVKRTKQQKKSDQSLQMHRPTWAIAICVHNKNHNVRKRVFLHVRQTKLKSARASAQSDRSLRFPHEEALPPWLSKMRPVEILIRLRKCAGRSESSLGAHVF